MERLPITTLRRYLITWKSIQEDMSDRTYITPKGIRESIFTIKNPALANIARQLLQLAKIRKILLQAAEYCI